MTEMAELLQLVRIRKLVHVRLFLIKLKQGNGYKHERHSCEADIQTDGRTDGRTQSYILEMS